MVTPPNAYPLLLGDLAVSATASTAFTVDFQGCDEDADFLLTVPWVSATYETGAFVTVIHDDRGRF